MRINTKHERDIIQNAAFRIMTAYEKLGDSDEELELWCEMDKLTDEICKLADKIEEIEEGVK